MSHGSVQEAGQARVVKPRQNTKHRERQLPPPRAHRPRQGRVADSLRRRSGAGGVRRLEGTQSKDGAYDDLTKKSAKKPKRSHSHKSRGMDTRSQFGGHGMKRRSRSAGMRPSSAPRTSTAGAGSSVRGTAARRRGKSNRSQRYQDYRARGQRAFWRRQYTTAERYFLRARSYARNKYQRASMSFNLTRVYLALGRTSRARYHAMAYLRLSSSRYGAYTGLRTLYRKHRQYRELSKLTRYVRRLDPRRARRYR